MFNSEIFINYSKIILNTGHSNKRLLFLNIIIIRKCLVLIPKTNCKSKKVINLKSVKVQTLKAANQFNLTIAQSKSFKKKKAGLLQTMTR